MEIDKDVNKNGDQEQEQQPKKQSRKRIHNNKPYQERFLNMSEARKEIATALKFHRASMKQQETSTNHYNFQSSSTWKLNSGMCPSTATTTNYPGSYSFPSHNWPMSTFVPPPPPPLLNQENVNLVLPSQTLGLNLNFQDFNNINTSIYHKPVPVSSPSTSSGVAKEAVVVNFSGLHQDMESDEMEEDRKGVNSHEEGGGYDHPFEQVMEFPPWLINSNDHHFSHEYSPDPPLPW